MGIFEGTSNAALYAIFLLLSTIKNPGRFSLPGFFLTIVYVFFAELQGSEDAQCSFLLLDGQVFT